MGYHDEYVTNDAELEAEKKALGKLPADKRITLEEPPPEMKSEVNFTAGYGRPEIFEISKGICHRCEKPSLCLCVDSSDEEYEPGRICLPCVKALFAENDSPP